MVYPTLKTLWYEDSEGNKLFPEKPEIPDEARTTHPYQNYLDTSISHRVTKIITEGEVQVCLHPTDKIVETHGWIEGVEGRECRSCLGIQTRSVGDPWPETWGSGHSRTLCEGTLGYSSELVEALITRGGVALHDALLISALSCEPCMNVLAYRLGLPWGVRHGSETWRGMAEDTDGCDLCRYIDETAGFDTLIRWKNLLLHPVALIHWIHTLLVQEKTHMTYFVEIVHSLTDTLEKRLPYSSERMAEKGECGVNRNLDHEKYHTQITSEDVPLEDEVG